MCKTCVATLMYSLNVCRGCYTREYYRCTTSTLYGNISMVYKSIINKIQFHIKAVLPQSFLVPCWSGYCQSYGFHLLIVICSELPLPLWSGPKFSLVCSPCNSKPVCSTASLHWTSLQYSELSLLLYSRTVMYLLCILQSSQTSLEVFQSWRQNEHIWLEMIQYCSSMSNLWRNEPDMIYMNSEMLNRYIQVQRDWEKVLTVMGICYIRVLFQTFYC